MHADSMILAVVLGLSVLLSGVDIITKSVDEKYKIASQLSVHAYQTNVGHSMSMAGPFLSKVRVTPNATRLLTATADLNTQTEKYCTSAPSLPEGHQLKCNMSRTADMYFGDIHSSWSVLGSQSAYTLVKHIFCILLTFSLFWMAEHMIQTEVGLFRNSHKQVRVVILIFAIVIFAGNVIFDIQGDMYDIEKVAIGSITTGIAFCVVCLLIICFTLFDDPPAAAAAAGGAVKEGATITIEVENSQRQETVSLLPTATADFMPSLWSGVPSLPGFPQTVRTTDDGDGRYRRLEDMYLNIHASYLVLLLLPLFLILALTAAQKVVVDVHLQLFFFSSIFFAVLDIFQTRVMSVLASLTQSSAPAGFFIVKFFVVLAFILCKLLVIVPTWQLLLAYYARDGSASNWLVVWQIVLFAMASVVDLLYISDYYNPKTTITPAPDADISSPEKVHVMYRRLGLAFYLVASSITVLYV